MKRWLLFLLFLPLPAQAGNLISSATWAESGDFKMAQQDQYPYNISSNTISRVWDGTTIKLFGGLGELITWVTYLNCSAAGNANNVMVALSSFTGTGAALGSGFAGINVSSMNVWDFSQRPYALYKYEYLQQIGMDQFAAWDPTEYDEQQVAPRWQRPCTIQGAGYCSANGGTNFLSRMDPNKFYPAPAVPIEEFQLSSFTVYASSSQAIGGEVYVSTTLPAGTYTATLTVTEGVSVSTTIPVQLLIYNVILPPLATLPVIADVGWSDLDIRLTGTRFPNDENVEPYRTNHLRTNAFLHRHKVIEIGDQVPTGTDVPSNEFMKHFDSSAYRETYGLATNTGPGYATPETFYMINTYGNSHGAGWSQTLVTNGSTGYCDNVSSWTAFCTNNNLNCQMYTFEDEAAENLLETDVNKWSTWNATAPACAFSGHKLPFLQTALLPRIVSLAPNVNTVLSTTWLSSSTANWQTYETLYNVTDSSHGAGGYNNSVGVDSLFSTQEEGFGPREVLWGAYKTAQKYWFLWESNYWNDSNNAGQTQNGFNANTNNDNSIYKNTKTFGYDAYPSTDNVKGHFGFNWSSNGNMLYPSSDTISGYSSYGFNGVIGSWQLNQLTRGIQDVDIISLANAINPAATNTIVNQQVQDVMYLRQCFTLSDCTYSYGKRPWSEVINSWETARESLLQIAAGIKPPTGPSELLNGAIKINGTATLQ